MKIGIISDAHGNVFGLQGSLAFLRHKLNVDMIFFLGDAVGYMPDGKEVLDILVAENIPCLLGNHEAMLLGWLPVMPELEQVYRLGLTRNSLSQNNFEFIKKLLPFRDFSMHGLRILMTHGSPIDPLNGYFYPDTPLENLDSSPYDFILMGHTHRPFIRQQQATTIVNVGSCGMPRDNGALASVATLDTNAREVKLYRLALDIVGMSSKYKSQIHQSVEALWHRTSENIVGEIIQ